ncbi:MAG: head decoration protein [Desulfovibrio sp.]|nr:head decoration protein [Desulfovibrio sp.]
MSKVRVATHVFPKVFSELVLHELDPRYSRESASILAESAMAFGTVLTRGADGNYAPLKETDGTLGDAHAVYIGPGLAASSEVQSGLILRGYSIINGTNLVFDASVTLKANAMNALRDRGFVVKEVPSDVDA